MSTDQRGKRRPSAIDVRLWPAAVFVDFEQ
jgi:hypothetical protein